MSRSLEGIRVVDLSHVLAAPTVTMYLADLGAEVLHIEPPIGDDAREFGPFAGDHDKNHSGYFISLNRNKKGLVLNLKQPKAKDILRELIKISDVVVENFRPTTMRKLGFGWEDLKKINPRIVYCSICGFGQDSLPEYSERPSYDMVAQAYSGLMSITGPEGGPPCRVGSSVGDILTGLQATIGILAALRHRDRTGRGQHVDMAMIDSVFATLENAVARYTISGEIPGPLGGTHPSITPFQGYKTKDGSYVIAAIGTDALFVRFAKVIGRPDLPEDERFKTNPLRTRHREALNGILDPIMMTKTTPEWGEIFEKEGLPYSPINNMKQICEDPHIAYRKMLVDIDQPRVGRMRIAASPIRMSETPGEVYAPAPLLGQHTDEVLKALLGYSDETIAQLKKEGVINDGF
ncbi:MAG: CaiB/BaiF CoA-transferase family protein [Pseudomonadota bacterium]|nr:CaiB/BaiF CoA-transferase family protein [Pseudomonadota bacterium]NLX30602.1 CoA transferase [Deltaproteobacteria bacterium]HNU85680.1 CaiB/BaiF CoA-transferase family protein [Syntrophales bacterium]HNZ35861.1 CaiB/BaiF CoA-transferase family protein [Syntrophales bacterium]HOF73421.1 CaiB/BaiF CoA-transferase family protein [Syntrophales bacterium]